MTERTVQARRRWSVLPLLAALPLAGCGGAGTTTIAEFLSSFNPPAPLDGSVLEAFFADAMLEGVGAAAEALLGTARYDRQNSPSWSVTLYNDVELNGLSSHPLRTSGAAFAHAAGLTGAGSTIAIADYRIDGSHEVLAGTALSIDSNRASDQPPPGSGSDTGWISHGTAVASVAAGDSAGFVGTAPGASILFGTYDSDFELAALAHAAADAGAVAMNNSWGYASLIPDADGFDGAFGYPGGDAYLAALDRYAADGVAVFALPNDNTLGHATILDGLPYLRPTLEAGWIAAGNAVPTMSGSTVTGVRLISGACYEAARWCLLADGAWEAADPTAASGFDFVTGSSFAAPQIAGALALLEEAFPGLDPHALRVRLLASAEDSFFVPDDTVTLAEGFEKGYSVRFGHGFLDIEAALKPIGTPTARTAEGAEISLAAAPLVAGTAMGDAVARSLAGTAVGVTDALDATFAIDGAALGASAAPRPQAAAMLARSLSADLARERIAPGAAPDPFAAFPGATVALEDPEGLTRTTLLLPVAGSGSAAVNLSRAVTEGPTRVQVGLSLGRDAGGTLALGGPAGNAAALLASVSLGVTQGLGSGGWVALSGEVGLTDLGGDTAFGRTTAGRFDSARIELGQAGVFSRGDRLALSVSLPVALQSGRVEAMLPVATPAGMAFESRSIALAPEARQVDLGLTYQAKVGGNAEVKLSLISSENFGNIEGRRDHGAAVAFTLRF